MLLDVPTDQLTTLMEEGRTSLKQNNQQQALLYFNRVVLLNPQHIQALVHCAEILLHLNRPAEAIIYSQQALQFQPECSILSVHAQALYQMGNYAQALTSFDCILADKPNNYIAMGQKALCLTQVNRYDEAAQAYQQALAGCAHQDVWILYNYSLCLLATGDLLSGFQLFEYRWLTSLSEKRHIWNTPEHGQIEMLQGKSILIHSEQGLGDSIQFFRYIPLLVQLGARVVLELQPSLIPLFSNWRHTIRLIAKGSSLPACDYNCSIISLARLFRTELQTIPCSVPYVFPDPQLLESCQNKLGDSPQKRIGIAWRGSSANAMNHKRSLKLHTLLAVHQTALDFVCLQKDVDGEEKKILDQYQIPYHSLELSTMPGTAALIACLDLIVTVDTSIAHLAAAMGKEVWIVLPFSADWRWFLQREDSPWYPHVRLFRQSRLGDWNTPLEQIRKSLTTLAPTESLPTIEELMIKAASLGQQGSWQHALERYKEILIQHPNNADAAHGAALAALEQNTIGDAISFMQRALDLAPESLVYRRNLGELLCRSGQLESAITLHQKTLTLEPQSAENHFLLALAYNNNRQFELAVQHYRLALSYESNYGLAWNNLGASLESLGDKEQAKQAYSKAIGLNSKHAEAQNNLGALYSEEGLITEASSHFAAAIEAKPDFIEAHYNLSQVKTYNLDDPHLTTLAMMEQKSTHASLRTRIYYYFALGKALDDTKNYTKAFQAYAEGNRLHYAQHPWNKTQLGELVDQMATVFRPSFFKQQAPSTEKRCPIFIVGMPRSGTTLIEQILASHKSIYGAGELSILDEVIQSAWPSTSMPFHVWVAQLNDKDFAVLGARYLDRTWQLAKDKEYIIDKMPSNCFYIGMIYRMLPHAKIIHSIRDPMDSCFSCFTHLFKDGMWFAYDLKTLGEYYQLYAKSMHLWHEVLPPHTLFDVPYERLVANHEAYTKELLEFIGVPWDSNCLNFYTNNRIVKTASLTQVRKPIYKTSVQRWQHFSEHLQPLLNMVSPLRHMPGISA